MKYTELAKKTNLNRQYIKRVIEHKVDNPGIKTLRKIAEAMQIPFEDLGY